MSHIYLKENLNQEWRKHYLNGKDVSDFSKGNNWKSFKKIEWTSFKELENNLLPYLEGENNSIALMIGNTQDIFVRAKANVEDEELDYLLLDIETDLPHYADINRDLSKIRGWLIEQYDWLDEEIGMLLFFSNSASVHCEDKHKQIRIRAIVRIDKALKEEERVNLLKGFSKGRSKQSLEYNHIDATTLRRATASIIAPTKLENTKRDIRTSISLVIEGKAVEVDKIIGQYIPIKDNLETTSKVLSKSTQEWIQQIEKGNTYESVWKAVWSCVMRCESRNLIQQNIIDRLKVIGSDRWKEVDSEFRTANAYVRKWFFLNDLKEQTKHNLIKLDTKYISEEGIVNWNKNGTIHIRSGVGSGKTTSLKKLIEDNSDKSILYIGKNIGYVRNAAEQLDLDDYLDEEKFPSYDENKNPIHNRKLWKSKKLSICYPSLPKLRKLNGNLSKFDIVIIDEARQLLAFSATASIINDKNSLAVIMGKLVENAELVVCCDADLDDLTIKAIEIHRGNDECFDIYWNTFHSLRGKKALMCRSPSEILALAVKLAKSGKTFALVGDFSPKGNTKYPIPRIKDMLAKHLKPNEIFTLHSMNSQDDEQQDILKNPNQYLTEKLENGLKVFIASPSITSGWDYKSHIKFDYVLGFYPYGILTANEVVQQLRRFRDTDDFFVWIKPTNQHTGYELERLSDIWDKLYGYSKTEFSPIHELKFEEEKEMFDKREEIRMSDNSGLDSRFREITKARNVSLCNLRLHFDFIWKENGGITELSPYFDELWQQQEEGKEIIKRNSAELKNFYELRDDKWKLIFERVKRAKPITKEEYKKILLSHSMLIEDSASAIAYEIREEFDVPEDEMISEDVWFRFNDLNLLTEAHKNREIMSLSLSECEQIDAEAKSMPDKPNYVIRWLLLSEIKQALKIKEIRPLKIKNKILFEKDIQKIVKVIQANKKLLKELGFAIDKEFESYPFNTIKKLLLKKLDLKAEFKRGLVNGSQKEQDEIIEHYKKNKIFQDKFGIGQNGWSKQLPSRERRWKFCKEEIENIPFKKLNPQQAKYYLSFTPHIEVSQWKYNWKGKNAATKNSESLFNNLNEHLSMADTKLIQVSLAELS